MSRSPLYVVDAFCDGPFTGNPAAVCLLDGPHSDGWMQSVAAELNLSETAFVTKRWDGFELRWFTPVSEVRLCGHATLAAAHVLWETGRLDRTEPARFQTHAGPLAADRVESGVQVDLPAIDMVPAEAPAALLRALGIKPLATAATADPSRHDRDWLFELSNEQQVRGADPDFVALRREAAGFIVTARVDRDDTAIVSRYFAPAWGINEDPATGAAHCALGPYWMPKLGVTRFPAAQASARGGRMIVDVEQPGRVFLTGRAVLVSRGELCVSDPARAVAGMLADVRRAATAAGRRAIGERCWIEGRRAHERALRAGATIDRVLWVAPGGSAAAIARYESLLEQLRRTECELLETDGATIEALTNGRSARGPVGLARMPPWHGVTELLAPRAARLLLVAADVEDPGNVGALSRTALAAGAAGLVVTGISDPWHPRAVRTSMGSVFKLPLARFDDAAAARRALAAAGVLCVAAVSHGGESPRAIAVDAPVACFVGGEAFGLDETLAASLDRRVTIPMNDDVDSYSVNAAAAILLYALGRA